MMAALSHELEMVNAVNAVRLYIASNMVAQCTVIHVFECDIIQHPSFSVLINPSIHVLL